MGLLSALFGSSKTEVNKLNYQMAIRQIDTETVRNRPAWLGNDSKEKEFFNGVVRLTSRVSVPAAYVVRGFISPGSAEVMFSFAASMESKGASFTEQQMATAKFIEEAWGEMSSDDKGTFLRATVG